MLNMTTDASGKLGSAYDATVTFWAGPQIPSASQAQWQHWTATAFSVHTIRYTDPDAQMLGAL